MAYGTVSTRHVNIFPTPYPLLAPQAIAAGFNERGPLKKVPIPSPDTGLLLALCIPVRHAVTQPYLLPILAFGLNFDDCCQTETVKYFQVQLKYMHAGCRQK